MALSAQIITTQHEQNRRRCVMWKFFKGILLPSSIFAFGGQIVSVLSILTLVEYSADYGFGSTLERIVEAYGILVLILTERLEPFVGIVTHWVTIILGWDGEPQPYWRHVFVLMSVLVISMARTLFRTRLIMSGLFYVIVGLFFTLITSAVVAMIPLSESSFAMQFLIGFIPVIGISFYMIFTSCVWGGVFLRDRYTEMLNLPTQSWAEFSKKTAFQNVRNMLIAGVIIFVGLWMPFVQQLPAAGLVMLAVIIIIYAIAMLFDGLQDALMVHRDDESLWNAYLRMGGTRIGKDTLLVFVLTTVALFFDAGGILLRS